MCQKLTHASQQNDVLEFLVLHSSNASAPMIIPGGISSPSALAVLRLTGLCGTALRSIGRNIRKGNLIRSSVKLNTRGEACGRAVMSNPGYTGCASAPAAARLSVRTMRARILEG